MPPSLIRKPGRASCSREEGCHLRLHGTPVVPGPCPQRHRHHHRRRRHRHRHRYHPQNHDKVLLISGLANCAVELQERVFGT